MSVFDATPKKKNELFLDKWYLDFVSNKGESMIIYSSLLTWKSVKIPYTSYLFYDSKNGLKEKSRLSKVSTPIMDDDIIWNDQVFEMSGKWESMTRPIEARLFDSNKGSLNWHCHQPMSSVQFLWRGKEFKGKGYVEQLKLSVYPWRIPIHELRWGRYSDDSYNMVWIAYGEKQQRQWLWMNGEFFATCLIQDHLIRIPEKNMELEISKVVVLESERKIQNVVKKLIRYIPGFEKVIPLGFLMADEFKWLSKGVLKNKGSIVSGGNVIHELVQFKL